MTRTWSCRRRVQALAVCAAGCSQVSAFFTSSQSVSIPQRGVQQPSCTRCSRQTQMVAATSVEEEKRVGGIQEFTTQLKRKMQSDQSPLDAKQYAILEEFLDGYSSCCIRGGTSPEQYQANIGTLIKTLPEQMKSPYQFELFHPSIREPFDLYKWGNEFFLPMVDMAKSRIDGTDNLKKIAGYLEAGENVFLLSNHQTEADPQVISLLLEREGYQAAAEKLINVAGHRVTTDPLAIPFSMGRNLFCIFSKKYMENPPELKGQKQQHNIRTLRTMSVMLAQGGQFIWVAPSGGRDRPDPQTKEFIISPFDPKSVEVFRIMAAKAAKKKTTHFFPFAMWTNKLVPPPDEVNKELGERRTADRGPVSIAFCDEVTDFADMSRVDFAATFETRVKEAYAKLDSFHKSQAEEA